MGCWHGTCGLTQLPIRWQQKVKLFLLMEKYFKPEIGGGFCHSTEMYMPFYLPISGTYNDYGSIENIETDLNTDLIIQHFKNAKSKDTLIINEPEYSKLDINSIDSIVHHVERGYISFKNTVHHERKVLDMSAMMVLDDVYNVAVNITKPMAIAHLTDIEKSSIKYIKQALKFGTYEEVAESYKKAPTPEKLEALLSFFRTDNTPWFRPSESMYWVHDLLKENAIKGIRFREIMHEIKKLMLFNYFMMVSRKHYSPQSGAGSQNANYDFMAKFYKSVSEISAKIGADWKKECGE